MNESNCRSGVGVRVAVERRCGETTFGSIRPKYPQWRCQPRDGDGNGLENRLGNHSRRSSILLASATRSCVDGRHAAQPTTRPSSRSATSGIVSLAYRFRCSRSPRAWEVVGEASLPKRVVMGALGAIPTPGKPVHHLCPLGGMVDASRSGRDARKGVRVQVSQWVRRLLREPRRGTCRRRDARPSRPAIVPDHSSEIGLRGIAAA